MPGWDLGVDFRNVIDAQRMRDLPRDPQSGFRQDIFHGLYS